MRSEFLNNSQSDMLYGVHIFAVKKKNVEADRKAQRGQ